MKSNRFKKGRGGKDPEVNRRERKSGNERGKPSRRGPRRLGEKERFTKKREAARPLVVDNVKDHEKKKNVRDVFPIVGTLRGNKPFRGRVLQGTGGKRRGGVKSGGFTVLRSMEW